MKKFLTVLAAGAMGVALVGCGSSAPKDSGAPASDATSSTANTSTSTGKRVSLAKETMQFLWIPATQQTACHSK